MNVSTPMRTSQPPRLAVQDSSPRAPKPAQSRTPGPKQGVDEYFRDRTPEEVASARAVIAEAHRATGGIPLRNAAKGAYIREAEAELARAKDALWTLSRAEMDGVLPREAYDAQRELVGEIANRVSDAKARQKGEPLIGKPLNPFRPLWQVSSDFARHGGIIGGLLAPIGVFADIADAITRPIQALIWPVAAVAHYGEKGLRAVGKLVGLG